MYNEPNNYDAWLKAYHKTKNVINIASKFVNNIINNTFNDFFTDDVKLRDLLWMPYDWFKYVYDNNYQDIADIYYHVKNNEYTIFLHFIEWDVEEENELNIESLNMSLTKEEYIIYLAKLFYFYGDDDDFSLRDEGDEEGDYQFYTYKDLKRLLKK